MDTNINSLGTPSLTPGTTYTEWRNNRYNSSPTTSDRFIREVNHEAFHLNTKVLFNNKNTNYEYNSRLYNALYGNNKKINLINPYINNNFNVPRRVFKKPNGDTPVHLIQEETYSDIKCLKKLDAPGTTNDYYSSQMAKVSNKNIAVNLGDITYLYNCEKFEIVSKFEYGPVKKIDSNREDQLVIANDLTSEVDNRFSNKFSIWDIEYGIRVHKFRSKTENLTTFGLADNNSPLHNTVILGGKKRIIHICSTNSNLNIRIKLKNVDPRIHKQAVRLYGSGNHIYIGTNTGIDVRDIRYIRDSIFSMFTDGAIRAIDNDSSNLYFGGGSTYPKATKVHLNSGSVVKNYEVGGQVTNIVTTDKFLYLSKGYPIGNGTDIDILNKKKFKKVSQSSELSKSRCKDLVMLNNYYDKPGKLVALFEPDNETVGIYEPLNEGSMQRKNHFAEDPIIGLSNRFSSMNIIR